MRRRKRSEGLASGSLAAQPYNMNAILSWATAHYEVLKAQDSSLRRRTDSVAAGSGKLLLSRSARFDCCRGAEPYAAAPRPTIAAPASATDAGRDFGAVGVAG